MSDHKPRLLHIDAGGEKGRSFPLRVGRTVIGRSEGDLVFSDDPLLSGTHASIHVETVEESGSPELRCVLRDENSSNGVYVRIRGPQTLHDGDMIAVGKQVIRFETRHPAAPLKRVT